MQTFPSTRASGGYIGRFCLLVPTKINPLNFDWLSNKILNFNAQKILQSYCHGFLLWLLSNIVFLLCLGIMVQWNLQPPLCVQTKCLLMTYTTREGAEKAADKKLIDGMAVGILLVRNCWSCSRTFHFPLFNSVCGAVYYCSRRSCISLTR